MAYCYRWWQPLCPDCVCPIAVLACGPGDVVVWHTVTGGGSHCVRTVSVR